MISKIQVYGNPTMNATLQKVLGLFDITHDAIYVDMDAPEGEFNKGQGLTLANKLAEENHDKKIMIYGFDSIQGLWLESNFRKAMANPNVRYVQAPFQIVGLPEIMSKEKFENPALKAVADVEYKKNLVGKLKHDHFYRPEEVLNRARAELGLSGSDEEVKEKLFAYEPKSKIEPQLFPGVFCDIEMTLLEVFEGAINKGLIKRLDEYSKTKPINIWTGGDLKEIVPHLRKAKIEYPLLSKDWFKGCEVEIAIDDLPQEKFEGDYKIKAKEYQKINPEEWLDENGN